MFDQMVTDEAPPAHSKEGLVRNWRFDEFRRLGFGEAAAFSLVNSPAELSVARRLIGLGCPLATAQAILE